MFQPETGKDPTKDQFKKLKTQILTMPKCTYCGENYEFPRGLTLVDLVGKVKHFCSGKCRKYALMGRSKGKWARVKGKEAVIEEAKEKKAEKEVKQEEKAEVKKESK
jgi:ribosomal protein L24E